MQMTAAEREALRERMQELRQVGIDVREAVRGELAQSQGGAELPPLPPLPAEAPPAPGTPQGMPQETWTMVPPRNQDIPDIPPGVQDISIAFFAMIAICVVGFPLARAIGRRIEGRTNQPAALSPELGTQLLRIEQAVDAMAIEVERISESQRYLTRLQTEREALPASRHQG